MSEVLQIRLRPGDDETHDRLRDIFNLQTSVDRMARHRRTWTALVAAASVPVAVCAFRAAPAHSLTGWSLAIWATSFLAAVGYGLAELKCRRRLRDLLAHPDA
jgi:hypothetical protein